jgi:hypothetical protein
MHLFCNLQSQTRTQAAENNFKAYIIQHLLSVGCWLANVLGERLGLKSILSQGNQEVDGRWWGFEKLQPIASYAPSTALEAGKNVIVEFFTSGL